jgi:hypothetical protein
MRLQGTSYESNRFRVKEGFKKPDFEIIHKMLDAENMDMPVYIVREYYDSETCSKLKSEFFRIINETQGGNRQEDFVPVQQIGSTQFMKTTKEYFDECDDTKMHIQRLINSLNEKELINDFMLEHTLKKEFGNIGRKFRPSRYNNREVNTFTARKWTNEYEDLALLPHEDFSQLNVANSENYEIGSVKKVIACNLCISNDNGGEFLIWNIDPSTESKRKLNVENNGYPYPVELLTDFEIISLDIRPGDLYFIHANFIHAIKEIKCKDRISLGRFMGINEDKEIIYWT